MEKNLTVVMDAIEDGEGWFWNISVGHAGPMNYLNMMKFSLTMQRILSGEFPPKLKYTINGKTRYLPYWLADGIYPAFALFAKAIKGAVETKLKCFSSFQEAMRKDIERVFGILMKRFHFLSSLCRMWNKEDAMEVLRACIILHNMYVEHRRDHYEVPMYANAVSAVSSQFASDTPVTFQWENMVSVPADAPAGTWAAMAASRREESTDSLEHETLRLDLIEYLWAKRGLSQQQ
jgi:Plant transposon protein